MVQSFILGSSVSLPGLGDDSSISVISACDIEGL